MKKFVLILTVAVMLLAVFAAAGFAYSFVQGCVVDLNGDPWTHGGTVTFAFASGGAAPVNLDANGCFTSPVPWSVANGNPTGTATIDPNAGPAGDPGPLTCDIPADASTGPNAIYDCGALSTGTGPNAVVWQGMNASTSSGMTLGLAVLGLLGLAGVAAFWRRKQLAA